MSAVMKTLLVATVLDSAIAIKFDFQLRIYCQDLILGGWTPSESPLYSEDVKVLAKPYNHTIHFSDSTKNVNITRIEFKKYKNLFGFYIKLDCFEVLGGLGFHFVDVVINSLQNRNLDFHLMIYGVYH